MRFHSFPIHFYFHDCSFNREEHRVTTSNAFSLLMLDKTYRSYRIGEENLTSTQQAIAQEDFLLREPRPCLEDQIHLREDLFKITSKLQGINASSRPFGGEQPYFMDDNHDTFYPYNKPFVD